MTTSDTRQLANDTRQPVPAVVTTLRWVAITIGCVFAADTAVAGEIRGVFAVGLGVLVAVWWTLRPQLVHPAQDVVAALVLVAADLASDQLGAFIPAVIVALLPIVGRRWLVPDDEEPDAVDIEARLRASVQRERGRTDGSQAGEPARADDSAAEMIAEERRRAGRLYERVADWLTYFQVSLDRYLSRRPDHQLAALRDDITESIHEVEERSRQLRARVTPSAPLSSHAGRLLEWWSHHHGSDVTLRISDPGASLDPAVEQQLLTILQEAVDNAGRHADAEHLDVSWDVKDRRGTLVVSDDGCGFDTDSVSGPGLAAMARAAARAGARLEIESGDGDGTTVRATVPG